MKSKQNALILRDIYPKNGRILHDNRQKISFPEFRNLVRPPVYGSNGRSYKMLVMFFLFF